MKYISKGADITPGGVYRYSLWRQWKKDPDVCIFIGLNPSTADGEKDDNTITRCVNFADNFGCGRLVMVNLFSFRATKPSDMLLAQDPIGRKTNKILINECSDSELVIACWGNHGNFMDRDSEVVELLSSHCPLYCLGKNKSGSPKHPLYLPKSSTPKPFA